MNSSVGLFHNLPCSLCFPLKALSTSACKLIMKFIYLVNAVNVFKQEVDKAYGNIVNGEPDMPFASEILKLINKCSGDILSEICDTLQLANGKEGIGHDYAKSIPVVQWLSYSPLDPRFAG